MDSQQNNINRIQTEIKETHPVILSVSRATDIPAFYCDWFFNRLNEGYCMWRNPFNNQKMKIRFDKVRFIVFWSKNPYKLIKYVDVLKSLNIKCYIQYTLNDYVDEDLETAVPKNLEFRIQTFKTLVSTYGPESVIWRFDPLILTDAITIDSLISKISNIGNQLKGYTSKLVFSFCGIAHYPKVKNNLAKYNVQAREWTTDEMREFARKLSELNKANNWNYTLATCAEQINFAEYRIIHNKCVDDDLIIKLAYSDKKLMDYLKVDICNYQTDLFGEPIIDETQNIIHLNDKQYALKTKSNKDKGQRLFCGCIASKDIGQYNTCMHKCKYCYANSDEKIVLENYKMHLMQPFGETIV